MLLYKELTGTIIGVYYTVYNGTSRTYPEYIYENAMLVELRERGVQCRRQEEYQVFYKGKLVGSQRLDLFIADEVCVELKAVPAIQPIHKAQTISYLKVTDKQIGLLFNFGSPTPEFARLYFEPRPPQNDTPLCLPQELPSTYLSPDLTYQIIGGLFEVHSTLGPGFIHRIYANACYHELRLRDLEVRPQRTYQVIYRGHPVGEIHFGHLLVEGSVFVFPVAIQDPNDLHIDNLKAWMRVQHIPIAILANFYDTSLHPVILRIR